MVFCAEKQQQGWYFHDLVFNKQAEYRSLGSTVRYKTALQSWSKSNPIQWTQMQTCLDSEEAQEAMTRMGQLGDKVGVRGTPAFYINGRSLSRAQLLPVLRAAYESLK